MLAAIGAADVRQLIVLNKTDLTGLPPAVRRDEYDRITRVRVSAKSGDGLPLLREALTRNRLRKTARRARGQPISDDAQPNPDMILDSASSL